MKSFPLATIVVAGVCALAVSSARAQQHGHQPLRLPPVPSSVGVSAAGPSPTPAFQAHAPAFAVQPVAAIDDTVPISNRALLRRLEAAEAELARMRQWQPHAGAPPTTAIEANFTWQPAVNPEGAQIGPPGSDMRVPYGPPASNLIPDIAPLPDPEYDRQEFDEGPIGLDTASIPGGRFSVRPRGRILFDGIFSSQSPQNIASVATIPGNRNLGDMPDFVGFNQARIGIEGEGYGNMFYEIEFDIAGDGRPDVTDMYMAVTHLPFLGTVFVGNQRVDLSMERVHSLEHGVFMERSLMQSLVPGRRPGIKFRNHTDDGRASWALGIYRNGDDDYGNTMSNYSNYMVAGRATFLPWYDETSEGRYWWHLGTSMAYWEPADQNERFRTRPEVGGVFDQDEGIRLPFFASTGDFSALRTQLLGFESALNLGALNFQSEYTMTKVDSPAAQSPTFYGGYVQASYFLTGESRVYRRNRGTYGRIRTYEDFFAVQEWPHNHLVCGRGAWQIAARVSHLDLIDSNINGGRLTDLTIGANWYLNRRTRIQFNYIHPFLRYGGVDSEADIFATRMSIFF